MKLFLLKGCKAITMIFGCLAEQGGHSASLLWTKTLMSCGDINRTREIKALLSTICQGAALHC